MGAVAQMARNMIVMYAGRPCEIGEVEQVIQTPRHPYTTGLISCVPHLDDTITDANNRLSEIPGIVPSIREFEVTSVFLHQGANIKWNNVGLSAQD